MVFLIVSQILLLIISPLLQFRLGELLLISLSKRVSALGKFNHTQSRTKDHWHMVFLLGLLVHLLTILFFKSLNAPWALAVALGLLPCLIQPKQLFAILSSIQVKPSINFLLWFTLSLLIGTSLFQTTNIDGIQTPWKNNYGDLAFHLGMITSFVWGENFPPEYHIFPGQGLSYPFLINLWSASIWWVYPNFKTLSIIFCFHWLLLWSVVYFVLSTRGNKLLPWALLFGGGTYFFSDLESSVLIRSGFPWVSFLDTIWVTQRSALLGLAVIVSALSLFHAYLFSNLKRSLVLATLLLSLSPLTHGHFFLTTFLYIAIVLGVQALQNRNWKNILLFTLCISPAVLSLPFLLGKAKIIQVSWGWMPWTHFPDVNALAKLLNSTTMWLNNAGASFIIALILLFILPKRFPIIVLLILFITANFVQVAVWNWDQIKIFIGLYVIVVSLWSYLDPKYIKLEFIILILIIPSAVFTYKSAINYKQQQIYSREDIQRAKKLRETTQASDIILAAPKHNSLVTLSGRKLFAGYEGTLSSHAIPYHERFKLLRDSPQQAILCRQSLEEEMKRYCPKYLLWGRHEQEHWKLRDPNEFQGVGNSELGYVFRIE